MFIALSKVTDLQRNDFIVAKFFDITTSTGHSMIVVSAPQAITAKNPLLAGNTLITCLVVSLENKTYAYEIIQGTTQYKVQVMDSTQSPHGTGTDDTRNLAGVSGQGLGTGYLRLYADSTTGVLAGYSWSQSTASTLYQNTTTPLLRLMVLGRIDFAKLKSQGYKTTMQV